MSCDSSNIDRVMAASSAQIEDIRYLENEMGLEKLPEESGNHGAAAAGKPGSVSGFAGRAAGAADWEVRRERPSAQNIGDCAQSPLRGGYAPRKLTVKEKNDGQGSETVFSAALGLTPEFAAELSQVASRFHADIKLSCGGQAAAAGFADRHSRTGFTSGREGRGHCGRRR